MGNLTFYLEQNVANQSLSFPSLVNDVTPSSPPQALTVRRHSTSTYLHKDVFALPLQTRGPLLADLLVVDASRLRQRR